MLNTFKFLRMPVWYRTKGGAMKWNQARVSKTSPYQGFFLKENDRNQIKLPVTMRRRHCSSLFPSPWTPKQTFHHQQVTQQVENPVKPCKTQFSSVQTAETQYNLFLRDGVHKNPFCSFMPYRSSFLRPSFRKRQPTDQGRSTAGSDVATDAGTRNGAGAAATDRLCRTANATTGVLVQSVDKINDKWCYFTEKYGGRAAIDSETVVNSNSLSIWFGSLSNLS